MNKLKEVSLIKSNFLSFGVLKIFDYIFPILLLPLLVRSLGTSEYGYYVIAGSSILIARLIIAFGFDLTATKEIALNSDNVKKINKIFWEISLIKLIFFIISFFVLLLVLCIFFTIGGDLANYWWLFLVLFISLLGDEVLYSTWFYMGMQKAKILSLFKITQRCTLLIGVFLMSKSDNVLFKVVFLESVLAIFFGLLSFFSLLNIFSLKIMRVRFKDCIFHIKQGYHVFLSNSSVYMYSSFNILVVGGVLGAKIAGIYAICERVYMAMRALFEPFTQAVYPYLNRLYKKNKAEYLFFSRKILKYYFLLLLLLTLLAYFFREYIIYFVMGEFSQEADAVLLLFLFALPLALGGMLSKYLVVSGRSNLLFRVTFISMLMNMILLFPFLSTLGVEGAVFTFIIVQTIQLLMQFYYYIRDFHVDN